MPAVWSAARPRGAHLPTTQRDLPELSDPAERAAAWPPPLTVDDATALAVLRDGSLELVGRLVASSNNAMVGIVSAAQAPGDAGPMTADERDHAAGAIVVPCVYKPTLGERPLWDFPDGTLADREAAAFLVSAATPWRIVPPTVLRDGPFGRGMVQLWLEADPTADPVAMVVEGDERLRRIALFDAVVNNADRKIGHLLPMPDGHVGGVDHGICFNEEPKLRTVLWMWRGDPLRDDELAVLRALRVALLGDLGRALGERLAPAEVAATAARVDDLLADGRFPHPDPDRPAIPWPPY